jgi:hypothetical protein
MKLSDISEFDQKLIMSMAQQTYCEKDTTTQAALIEAVLGYIHANGYDIIKSERESTWSSLENVHSQYEAKRRNW